MTSREVLEAALALPEEERLHLVEQLEASLSDVEDDDAFIDMINERVRASEAGAPAYPAEEVFARLRAR